MLNRSYKEILRNPTSFKRNVILILRDIDERLRELTRKVDTASFSAVLSQYAKLNHEHTNYSLKSHNHDLEYAFKVHTHSEYVRRDDDIAPDSMKLDGHSSNYYSQKGHIHRNMLYVATFTLPTNDAGEYIVTTKFPVTTDTVMLKENIRGLYIAEVNENHVRVEYDLECRPDNVTFHLLYWTTTDGEEEKVGTDISMEDVNANVGDTITLESVTTDEYNDVVTTGEVEYTVFET